MYPKLKLGGVLMGSTASLNRSRSALARNLPKRGWTVDGSSAKMGQFSLTLGTDGWRLAKDGKEIASGAYGPNQMGAVRAAVEMAGGSMPTLPLGTRTRKPLTDEQKAKLREKRQAARKAKTAGSPSTAETA